MSYQIVAVFLYLKRFDIFLKQLYLYGIKKLDNRSSLVSEVNYYGSVLDPLMFLNDMDNFDNYIHLFACDIILFVNDADFVR